MTTLQPPRHDQLCLPKLLHSSSNERMNPTQGSSFELATWPEFAALNNYKSTIRNLGVPDSFIDHGHAAGRIYPTILRR